MKNHRAIPVSMLAVGLIALFPCLSYSVEALDECVASRVLDSFVDIDFTPENISSRVQSHVQMESNAQLYRRGKEGVVFNELAKSTEIDLVNKKMTVAIDQTCRWSDDKPITVYDIEEGIRRLFLHENRRGIVAHFKNGVEVHEGKMDFDELGFRILSDSEIEFDLVVSPNLLQHSLAFAAVTPVPLHLTKIDARAWPGDSMVRVSSGPFVAVSHKENRIDFDRNPHYCNGLESNAKKIVLHGIGSRRSLSRLLAVGLVNIGDQISSSHLMELRDLAGFDDKFKLWSIRPEVMAYLSLNPNEVINGDHELTKALLLAIDYTKLESVGGADRHHGRHLTSLNFDYPGYQPVSVQGRLSRPYSVRLVQAKRIMESLGYDSDNKLKLRFGVRHSSPYEQLGFAMQGMLNQIYIDARVEIVDNHYDRLKYDLSLNAWGTEMSDPTDSLSGLALNLTAMGYPEFERKLTRVTQNHVTSSRNKDLVKLEQELLDMNIFHPVFEVLSPAVLTRNMSPGREFYYLGRNMIFDQCG